jgi:anti-sigma factor RsiW
LAWPARGLTRIGAVEAYETAERGFHVIMWRRGGLGYVLVSDVDGRELRQLAARLACGP